VQLADCYGSNSEARRGLQPRRLRFVCATMPVSARNVTDGITNPIRLQNGLIPAYGATVRNIS